VSDERFAAAWKRTRHEARYRRILRDTARVAPAAFD